MHVPRSRSTFSAAALLSCGLLVPCCTQDGASATGADSSGTTDPGTGGAPTTTEASDDTDADTDEDAGDDGTHPALDELPTDGFLGGFYPIGVFGQPAWTMQGWADVGLNTMLGLPQGDNLAEWDAQAQALGLKVIRPPLGAPSNDEGREDLLAWMLVDEPDVEANNDPCGGNCISLIESMSSSWRAADPSRPIFVNVAGPNVMQPWACDYCNGPGDEPPMSGCYPDNDGCYPRIFSTADWISQDIYPVTGWLPTEQMRDDITVVGRTLDRMRDWTDKPLFAIIELSDQRLGFDGTGTRGPTPDEYRAELWHAIIHGARGVFYFPQAFNPFAFEAVPDDVVAEMVVQHERIDAVAPLLQAEHNPATVTVSADAPLEVAWRTTENYAWLIVLNTVNAPGTGVLHVDAADGEVTVYGEDRTVEIGGGAFTDEFAPFEARVYAVPRD